MSAGCEIVGPYLPLGEVDWTCRLHGYRVVLKDQRRLGAHDLRAADFACIGDPTVVFHIYGADPLRSLHLRVVSEVRAEVGTEVVLRVIGVERVTVEGER